MTRGAVIDPALERARKIELLQAYDERARRSLKHFIKRTFPGYKMGWFHEEVCLEFEAFLNAVAAQESPRLILLAPPRHGKSEIASRRFPAYALGRYPDLSIISTSYAADLASSMNRDVQRIIDLPEYATLFPATRLNSENIRTVADGSYLRNSDIFEIVGKKGVYKSAGVGGGITGRGMDIGIVDDPLKDAEQAYSQVYRDKVWEWYLSTFYTRLMPGGGVVIILTRWHEDDLAGRILKQAKENGEQWKVVSFPAIAEKDEAHRKEGEPLHAERYGLEQLNRIKVAVGSRVWASLYQQRPAAMEGQIFRREWWKTYVPPSDDPQELIKLLGIHQVVQFWDTAFKTKTTNDYSVCVTMGRSDSRFYILDRWKGKAEFPELKAAVRSHAAKWMPHTLLIEDAASGQTLIQELNRETTLPVHPIKVDKDKITRAFAVTPLIEAGNVFYPVDAPWASDFIDVLATFPNAENDDDVDAFDGALNYLARGGGNLGMLDWLREEIAQRDRKAEQSKTA